MDAIGSKFLSYDIKGSPIFLTVCWSTMWSYRDRQDRSLVLQVSYHLINKSWIQLMWLESLDSDVCVCVCFQSCLTLCDPMDCSPPGSSVHGISQAGTLEWFAISSFRGSSQLRDWTWVSCIGRWILCCWTTGEALDSNKHLYFPDAGIHLKNTLSLILF